MLARKNLVLESPVYLKAPEEVQRDVLKHEMLNAAMRSRIRIGMLSFLGMIVTTIVMFIFQVSRSSHSGKFLLHALVPFFFAIMLIAIAWSYILEVKRDRLQYGKSLNQLRELLECDDKSFYSMSVDKLYIQAREKLKPIVMLIKNYQLDLDKGLSGPTAETINRKIELQRHTLKWKFDCVKTAGVFPKEMGYETLFDIRSRLSESLDEQLS